MLFFPLSFQIKKYISDLQLLLFINDKGYCIVITYLPPKGFPQKLREHEEHGYCFINNLFFKIKSRL